MGNFGIRLKRNRTGETITKGCLAATGLAALTGGVIILGSAVGALGGALSGEILDHFPYLYHAIPEGIGYLASYINPDAAEDAKNALEGNLDKVGAAMGFIGGFYKSSLSCKEKK